MKAGKQSLNKVIICSIPEMVTHFPASMHICVQSKEKQLLAFSLFSVTLSMKWKNKTKKGRLNDLIQKTWYLKWETCIDLSILYTLAKP